MDSNLSLPFFERLLPEGIDYGTNLLIEFDSDSIWYEASLTIAAQALRMGQRTLYHTFQHPAADLERDLTNLGLDLARLQGDGQFQMLDSLAVQLGGLAPVEKEKPIAGSLKISDLSISASQAIKKEREEGVREEQKRWLHIDDNTAIMTLYNPETIVFDYWRTRIVPFSRPQENIILHSILNGTVSDTFRTQFESINDGIFDFKCEEKEGEVEHLVRVRIMRGKKVNSRWHRLNMAENGEVTLAE